MPGDHKGLPYRFYYKGISNLTVGDGIPDVPNSLTFGAAGRVGTRPLQKNIINTAAFGRGDHWSPVTGSLSFPILYRVQRSARFAGRVMHAPTICVKPTFVYPGDRKGLPYRFTNHLPLATYHCAAGATNN